MANPALADFVEKIHKTTGVMKSAEVFINGSKTRMQAAVDAALKNGATEEQLKPITDEIALMDSEADLVTAAIAANP